jgi:hypothetical protein
MAPQTVSFSGVHGVNKGREFSSSMSSSSETMELDYMCLYLTFPILSVPLGKLLNFTVSVHRANPKERKDVS